MSDATIWSETMTYNNAHLAVLIGSRICHDLSNLIGAVSNGLELMELSGGPRGPEMALVSDSAASAKARILLFRLAFGIAAKGQLVSSDEVAEILRQQYAESRIEVIWSVSGEQPRPVIRAALLALLCAEQSLARGGVLTVRKDRKAWTVSACGEHLLINPALWDVLKGRPAPEDMPPAAVQFLLLPHLLTELGLNCESHLSENLAEIRF